MTSKGGKSTSSFSDFDLIVVRLNTLGYRVGIRVLELMIWRAESSSKAPKREIRLLPALMSIHTHVWRAVFGRPADALEKSVENADECWYLDLARLLACIDPLADMIIDNDPLVERHISVPKDLSQLSCSSFTAGIVEAVLDGLGLVRFYLDRCIKHQLIQLRSLHALLLTAHLLPSSQIALRS